MMPAAASTTTPRSTAIVQDVEALPLSINTSINDRAEACPGAAQLDQVKVEGACPKPKAMDPVTPPPLHAKAGKVFQRRRSLIQPEDGCCITFQELSYLVPSNKNRKQEVALLEDITGYLRPGEMSALMGPSGCGKTTLLDVLAGRKTVGRISGTTLFSGEKATVPFLRRYTGYVEQRDTLLDALTVYEMLMYTAELKRPVEQSLWEKQDVVEELIEHLGLESCRDTRIGSALTRGISGGQAKRVNVGIALVTSPRVLFLDEPTSSLDSFTATEVMRSVKGLVQLGITVVATVHSPTPPCFALFDRVLLLVKGRTIYFGPNGKAPIEYFQQLCLEGMPALAEGANRADWIIELTTEADLRGKTDELVQAYAKSQEKRQADADIAEQLQKDSRHSTIVTREHNVKHSTVTPWWWGIKTLLKYRTRRNYTNPAYLVPRMGGQLLFSFIYFSLYWKAGSDSSPLNMINMVQFLFAYILMASCNSIGYVPALVVERALFIRELQDGLYTVMTFLLAKLIEEFALIFLLSLIYSSWVFYTVQLQGSWLLFWLVYVCTLCTAVVLAYAVGAASPNIDTANMAVPVCIAFFLFFMGALIIWTDIPDYWRWAGYISFMRYAWGALMINQFEEENNLMVFPGMTILQYYSLDGASKWAWMGIEWAFLLVFFMLAFLALKYVCHVRR